MTSPSASAIQPRYVSSGSARSRYAANDASESSNDSPASRSSSSNIPRRNVTMAETSDSVARRRRTLPIPFTGRV